MICAVSFISLSSFPQAPPPSSVIGPPPLTRAAIRLSESSTSPVNFMGLVTRTPDRFVRPPRTDLSALPPPRGGQIRPPLPEIPRYSTCEAPLAPKRASEVARQARTEEGGT